MFQLSSTCFDISDLVDEEWEIIAPLLPKVSDDGRPRLYSFREILNAIFYVEKTGCQWRMLPKEFPKWRSVYGYFNLWCKNGLWERINKELVKMCRKSMDKNENISVGIIDSQSVKSTKKGASQVLMVGKM